MLKLPIFQKNKQPDLNRESEIPSPITPTTLQPSNAGSQISQHNKINKKKAEFEKKIRKFMESDSPHKPAQAQHPKKMPSDYSFEQDTFKTQLQQN